MFCFAHVWCGIADVFCVLTTVGHPQIICVVTREATEAQVNLVQAAATAGTVKQFFPSEFGILGAVGASMDRLPRCLYQMTERTVHCIPCSSPARTGSVAAALTL